MELSKADFYQTVADAQAPKQLVQASVPQLQFELCRKLLFDDFLIPLLTKGAPATLRYVDQELLATLRFFFVAASRLELSL